MHLRAPSLIFDSLLLVLVPALRDILDAVSMADVCGVIGDFCGSGTEAEAA